jgi:hypothetical protein
MKRTQMKRVPGTARMARNVFGLKPKRESPRETKFKREVRERDNYTCQFPKCGHVDKHIDVHHKAKRSQRPDLRFEVSNGICLCRRHHGWTDFHHDEAVSMGLLDVTSYELARGGLAMYECDTLGCPEYVSHPGQLCTACTQREEDDGEYDDEDYDEPDDYELTVERTCVKCGSREAIVNQVCGMCSELYPNMV